MEQLDTRSSNASLASWSTTCVPMDTYMTRNPCENSMLTNSNKAFINFNYL